MERISTKKAQILIQTSLLFIIYVKKILCMYIFVRLMKLFALANIDCFRSLWLCYSLRKASLKTDLSLIFIQNQIKTLRRRLDHLYLWGGNIYLFLIIIKNSNMSLKAPIHLLQYNSHLLKKPINVCIQYEERKTKEEGRGGGCLGWVAKSYLTLKTDLAYLAQINCSVVLVDSTSPLQRANTFLMHIVGQFWGSM